MGMLEDIMGEVLKSAVKGGTSAVQGRAGGGGGSGNVGGDPLTKLVASFLGADKKDASPILVIVLKFVEMNGGIPGILAKFQGQGMDKQAQSWVSTGENEPITGQQVKQAFDAQSLTELGKSLGTNTDGAADTLAKVLPELINQFTPEGAVPSNANDLLGMFEKMLTSPGR